MKNKLILLIFIYLTLSLLISFASAHRSGCHRWHSCPSDTGSYICGDIGYCSGCPDNEYCKDGQPRTINQPTEFYQPPSSPPSTSNATPTKTPAPIECKGTFQGIVEKIIDGDTLVIKGCKDSIRLSLVDAPEYNEEGYAEAKSFVERLCNVTSIATIDQDDKQPYDKYKRLVALVYCQNKKLNAELIYNRLGIIDARFCSTSEFVNEDWAKNYGCETKQIIQPKEFPSTGQIIKIAESKKEPKSVFQVIINFLKSIFQ